MVELSLDYNHDKYAVVRVTSLTRLEFVVYSKHSELKIEIKYKSLTGG